MKLLLTSVLFLFAFTAEAVACSCARPPEPCEAYADASAIFVGTVTFSTRTKIKEADYESTKRLVRFRVDRPLVNVEAGDIEITTGWGDADCGYGFRLGGQYLVYAYGDDKKKLSTSICTRTTELAHADPDLEYIDGLSKAPPGGTISGEVRLGRTTGPYDDRLAPVKDVRIIFEGPNTQLERKTNAEGKYSISGLPAGTYKVRIDVPQGLSTYNPEQELKITGRGCRGAYFLLEPDTRITGKVLDAQAMPAADVLMELIAAAGEPNTFSSYVRTDKEGRYVMTLVRPGRYYLGVRIAGSAGATYVPYPRTYFPGVKDRSQANVITITEGQRIELDELILPARFIDRTLNGVVVDEDGKPVAGAVVWLKERQYDDADMPYRRETDSEGRFSYPVYEGIKYSLNAYLEAGGRHAKRSEPFEVVITSNHDPIKIVVKKEK